MGADGRDLLDGQHGSVVLQLQEQEQLFTFQNIGENPVVSFLRDFSAPVRVESFQSREELSLLIRADSNLFNRWDAATRLASEVILEVAEKLQNNQPPTVEELFLDSVSRALSGKNDDTALLALALQLPPETTLAQEMDIVNPDALHMARQLVKRRIGPKKCRAVHGSLL